jgi:hypothetical protein
MPPAAAAEQDAEAQGQAQDLNCSETAGRSHVGRTLFSEQDVSNRPAGLCVRMEPRRNWRY